MVANRSLWSYTNTRTSCIRRFCTYRNQHPLKGLGPHRTNFPPWWMAQVPPCLGGHGILMEKGDVLVWIQQDVM